MFSYIKTDLNLNFTPPSLQIKEKNRKSNKESDQKRTEPDQKLDFKRQVQKQNRSKKSDTYTINANTNHIRHKQARSTLFELAPRTKKKKQKENKILFERIRT